jgi:hypothetical protein
VGQVAGHEHHAAALWHEAERLVEGAGLGVAVEAHGVAGVGILSAAAGVEDEDVEAPERGLMAANMRRVSSRW